MEELTMKKVIIICLVVMLCGVAHAQDNQETFAVVWEWSTGDREAVSSNMATQTTQLMDLWKQGVVENVYFNAEGTFADDTPFPTVVFFIKAENEDKAKKILNEMVFVKNGIKQYKLYPVGKLWLINYEDYQKINKEDQPKDD